MIFLRKLLILDLIKQLGILEDLFEVKRPTLTFDPPAQVVLM